MATIPTTATATMCPSPLPTISPLLRPSHQCQPSPSSSSPSSIKLGTTLFFNEATVDRAAESSVVIKPEKWGSQLEKRRKRRRRRRAGFERLEPEEDDDVDQVVEPVAEPVSVPVGPSRSGFLSRSEEVQLCLYLKVYSSYIIYGKFSNISPWQELKNCWISLLKPKTNQIIIKP
uniref:Uncharacterized protein n=1 Tax=Brassica oleracea var. oleracea TaxID=109376 RepID=A0A0D3EFQ1_BRAOL